MLPVKNLHDSIFTLLNGIRLTTQAQELLKKLIFTKYKNRLAVLEKGHRTSGQTIIHLKEQQQVLIQKNISGLYSDEIFKEQNNIIEEKLKQARAAQNDNLLKEYSVEKIEPIIENFISSLYLTYQNLELTNQRLLFSLIFGSKPSWNYPGLTDIHLSLFVKKD